jgi:hypothetical protein
MGPVRMRRNQVLGQGNADHGAKRQERHVGSARCASRAGAQRRICELLLRCLRRRDADSGRALPGRRHRRGRGRYERHGRKPGATGQTYVPAAGDVGHTLAVLETASNAAGPGLASSSLATVVTAASSGTPPSSSGTGSPSSTTPSPSQSTSGGGGPGSHKGASKPLTRAQRLAGALAACKKLKHKRGRSQCVAAAKKRYAPKKPRPKTRQRQAKKARLPAGLIYLRRL